MDIHPPEPVIAALEHLWAEGHAGYVVGGSLRDILLGREPADWDLATDARPDRILELFPGSVYENKFGTVAARQGGEFLEITTFRSDHEYADFRRPQRIEFGDTIEVDLARRDFTVNALAWGRQGGGPGHQPGPEEPSLIDPHHGIADLERRLLRAVGDPVARFEEDALRMVRAIRLAATLDFDIEPETLAGIRARSSLAAHLSGERLLAELTRLLAAERPSSGLRLMADTGLLEVLLPELAAERGIPQRKIAGDDLWDHTLRAVDAVPRERSVVRLTALLHDIGKPATMADGHFHGHETVGAEMAATVLDRLRAPRMVVERVVHLIRNHMFTYEPSWGDAGVRRLIRRIGRDALEPLFDLRMADNVGSGEAPDAHDLKDLQRRISEQLAGRVVLERGDLAVDGADLIRDLGLTEGPILGKILDDLLERAIDDPDINNRPTLLLLAESMLTEFG